MFKGFLKNVVIAATATLAMIEMGVVSMYAEEVECDKYSQAYEIDEDGIEFTFKSKSLTKDMGSQPAYIVYDYMDDFWTAERDNNFRFIGMSAGWGYISQSKYKNNDGTCAYVNTREDKDIVEAAGYKYEVQGEEEINWNDWLADNEEGVDCKLKAVREGNNVIVEFTNNNITSKAVIPINNSIIINGESVKVYVRLVGLDCVMTGLPDEETEYPDMKYLGKYEMFCNTGTYYDMNIEDRWNQVIGIGVKKKDIDMFQSDEYNFSIGINGKVIDITNDEKTVNNIYVFYDCFYSCYLLLEETDGVYEMITETGDIIEVKNNNIVRVLDDGIFLVEDDGVYSIIDVQGNILQKNVFNGIDLLGDILQYSSALETGNIFGNCFIMTCGTVQAGYNIIFFDEDWNVKKAVSEPYENRICYTKSKNVLLSYCYDTDNVIVMDKNFVQKKISIYELPEVSEDLKNKKNFRLYDMATGVGDAELFMLFAYENENGEDMRKEIVISETTLFKLLYNDETIIDKIQAADKGDSVEVKTEKNETLKADVLEAAKKNNVTLVIETANGMKWTIKADDITQDSLKDIDLTVEKTENIIPKETIDSINFDGDRLELSLAHSGAFGFKASLTVNVEAKNKGKFANLFYYNPETKLLEFMQSSKVGDNGDVVLNYNHASDYVIILSDVEYKADNKTEDNNGTVEESKTEDGNDKADVPNTADSTDTVLYLVALSLAASAAFITKERKEKKH